MSKALPLMDPASNIETDPVEAKRIMRKVDWRIIPLLQFLYMLTFLDRVNIGNARLWNLEKDLQMSGYEFNIIVLSEFEVSRLDNFQRRKIQTKPPIVFYVPYIILELPANYVFNRVEPRKFIGVIIFGWGCKNLSLILVSTRSHLSGSTINSQWSDLQPQYILYTVSNSTDRSVLSLANSQGLTPVDLEQASEELFVLHSHS